MTETPKTNLAPPRDYPLSGGLYDSQVRAQLHIRGDGYITIPQTHGLLTLWYEDHRMLVLKEKGHSEYYNQYNPPFKVPTQFHVYAKAKKDGVDTLLEIGVFPLNSQEDK